ncbi:SDR family oxidoreductase [Fodinisporobacter ferrooxydans]|uniref:SDR family oxidoreductase n=1 Tax=Fodinisporobacter ferrooxydans TaxID=2901836 RepID=A0ABY4CG95_9BACL|nr:SDR family oxidoreductase [Alicyclobacillaceae bacterium MYW30-H2]
MKVLVTGGAGFIGSNIVDKLVEENYEVVIIDNLVAGDKNNINKFAAFYRANITDIKRLRQIFEIEEPDYVIHQAAQVDVQYSLQSPISDANVNILGTIHLLHCCIDYHVKKLIYASSAAVYGDPIYLGIDEKHPTGPMSFYGISKLTPEHYIQTFSKLYGLQYTILRYANVYGIRQNSRGEGGVISIFIDRLLQNVSPVIFGDGEQTRDFIYVKDVAKANHFALTKANNEIVNIGCNQQTTVNEVLSQLNGMLGKDIKPMYKPTRQGDILHSYLDNTKARELLDWTPKYSLEEGLEETIAFKKSTLVHM